MQSSKKSIKLRRCGEYGISETITFHCMRELIFVNTNTFTIAYTYITIIQYYYIVRELNFESKLIVNISNPN